MVEIIESINMNNTNKIEKALVESLESLSYGSCLLSEAMDADRIKSKLKAAGAKVKEIIIRLFKMIVSALKFVYRFIRDGIQKLFRLTKSDDKLMLDKKLVEYIKARVAYKNITKAELIKSKDEMKEIAIHFLKNNACSVAKELNDFKLYRVSPNRSNKIEPSDVMKLVTLPQGIMNKTVPLINAVNNNQVKSIASLFKDAEKYINEFNGNKAELYNNAGYGLGLKKDVGDIGDNTIGIDKLGAKGTNDVIEDIFEVSSEDVLKLLTDNAVNIVPDMKEQSETKIGGFNKFKTYPQMLLNKYSGIGYEFNGDDLLLKKDGIKFNIEVNDISNGDKIVCTNFDELSNAISKNANTLASGVFLMTTNFMDLNGMMAKMMTGIDTDALLRSITKLVDELRQVTNAVVNIVTTVSISARHTHAMFYNLNAAIHYNVDKAIEPTADPNIKMIAYHK